MNTIKKTSQLTEKEKILKERLDNLPINTYRKLSDNKICDILLAYPDSESSYLAVKKFEALDTILITAKYCLSKACRFDHKVYSEKSGKQIYNETAQYQYNLHNLKSAVIWYNSSIDYILQIIYFGFGFYSPFTGKDYKEHFHKEEKRVIWREHESGQRNLNAQNFTGKFVGIASVNQCAKDVLTQWKQLYRTAKEVRKLADDMKHHSGFELNETAERSHNKIGIMIGDTPFCLDDVTQLPTIGYDRLIDYLMNLHLSVTSCEEYLYKALGFSNREKTPVFYYKEFFAYEKNQ